MPETRYCSVPVAPSSTPNRHAGSLEYASSQPLMSVDFREDASPLTYFALLESKFSSLARLLGDG